MAKLIFAQPVAQLLGMILSRNLDIELRVEDVLGWDSVLKFLYFSFAKKTLTHPFSLLESQTCGRSYIQNSFHVTTLMVCVLNAENRSQHSSFIYYRL